MVAEEVIITLSGGAPWGFRLQGGVECQKPLQVAKVRKRSKACRAGLREGDELVSINESPCGSLSHAQAMTLIDSSPGTLHIRVKRTPAGFQSVVLLPRAPSPRIDKEYRAALRAMSPSCSSRPQQPAVRQVHRGSLMSPTGTGTSRSGLTSPPGSEAYYGETDSDADVVAQERQRRQKRRSPSNSSPGKAGRVSPEGGETSEMSGYDSAPDPSFGGPEMLPGVARREVIYQPPPPSAWSSQTSTETSSMSADDQGPQDDSGFQDLPTVPLVSPERAKEAMMLTSRGQLVPMVGPIDTPVDEELTITYMDKAKQAKLHRGDTVQDKQVKEARTKCRTIASLLTDAPNPHSRGVLMFKKRRQRSKKYTLTSYGSVDEDMRQDSQEEDGMFPGSESEFDEDGFSAAPDPTWDSDYLDMLERRSASVVGHAEETSSPGLTATSGKGAQLFEQQRKRTEEHAKKAAIAQAQVQAHAQAQAQVLIQHQGQTQIQNQMQLEPQPDPLAAMHLQLLPQMTLPQMTLPQPAPPPQPLPQAQPSPQPPPVAPKPQQIREALPSAKNPPPIPSAPVVTPQTTSMIPNGDSIPSQGNVISLAPEMGVAPVATIPTGPAVSILTAPALTPLPELPSSSVLNRTARPFAPGFISNRAATAPVVFRPTVAKKTPRPVSVAVVQAPFSSVDERGMNAASFQASVSTPSLAPSAIAPTPTPYPPVEIPSAAPVATAMVPFPAPVIQANLNMPLGPMGPPMSVVPTAPIPAPVPFPALAPISVPGPIPVSAPVPQHISAPGPEPISAPALVPIPAPMPISPPAPMPVSAPVPASPQLARFSSSVENIQAATMGITTSAPPIEPPAPAALVATVAPVEGATMPMPVPMPPPTLAPVSVAAPVSVLGSDPTVPPSAPVLVPSVPVSAPVPLPLAPVSAPVPIPVAPIPAPVAPVPAVVPIPIAPVSALALVPAVPVPAPVSVPSVPPPASVSVPAGPLPAPSTATSSDLPIPTLPSMMHQSRLRGTTAGGRTGILEEARRRSVGRRMFHVPEDKKNSPNPMLLSMVQNLDERPIHRYSDPVYYDYDEEDKDGTMGKVPPPVAPKPRILHEATQIPHAEGKGAELFARRQSRMDQYIVDTPVSPTNPPQQAPQPYSTNARDPSPTQSLPSQWKYSPNVRAPPPIGYNPLLGPSVPTGPQRDNARPLDAMRGGRAGYSPQREGIKALDFLTRQPYQLNSAMFGGSSMKGPSQPQMEQREGYTLNAPRQIPVKAARVYEIKRFSTPTPMSAPTMTPKVIAPRSATTLGDRISRSDMTSPLPSLPPAPVSAPVPANVLFPRAGGLPELPKISANPVPNAHPLPFVPPTMSGLSYGGLQAAKQFKSAPELSALPPLKPAPVQVPKPRFVATRVGIQPRVWRPGALPH